jgi:Flp pilus assembly pilin Flp
MPPQVARQLTLICHELAASLTLAALITAPAGTWACLRSRVTAMTAALRNWFTDEAGAATVEYVLLVAAVVGLGVSAAIPIMTSTGSLAANVSSSIAAMEVADAITDDDREDDNANPPNNRDRARRPPDRRKLRGN